MSSFPLRAKYRLCCVSCFQDNEPLKLSHRCRYDLLVVQDETSKRWFRVRSGRRHKSFRGEYRMCRDWKRAESCPRGNSCWFAHGRPEVLLFTLEKDRKFNIAEFISDARLQCTGVMADKQFKQVNIHYTLHCRYLLFYNVSVLYSLIAKVFLFYNVSVLYSLIAKVFLFM